MITFIKQCAGIRSTRTLFYLSLFCVALSVMRIILTRTIFLSFLAWNLALAFIPWCIAITLDIIKLRNKWYAVCLIMLWLLFFPNAPYILTDMIHLKKTASRYDWFTFILILSYCFTGLFYGYVSLDFIERAISRIFKMKHTLWFVCAVLYLSAYGIYLGRFLRWNSWDTIVRPYALFKDIFAHIRHPVEYKQVWSFSFLMGTALILFYYAFKSFGNQDSAAAPKCT